jgi:hypothetical protein
VDQKERQVIDGLFAKLRQVATQSPQRDAEAEAYIARQVAALPAAPYYMAQAMLVQEQALANAQARIQQLEQQVSQRQSGGGGFLSGLFGGGHQSAPPPPRQAYAPQPQYVPSQYAQPAGGYGPWGGRGMGIGMGAGGGGFLAGAAQTALGVAGGMLAAEAIEHAFSGGAAHANPLVDQAGVGDTSQLAGELGAGDINPWGGQQDAYDTPQGAFDPSQDAFDTPQDPGAVDPGYADPGAGYDDPGAGDFGGGGDFGNDDNTI